MEAIPFIFIGLAVLFFGWLFGALYKAKTTHIHSAPDRNDTDESLIEEILKWATANWWEFLDGNRTASEENLFAIYSAKRQQSMAVKTPASEFLVRVLDAAWEGAQRMRAEREAISLVEMLAHAGKNWWLYLGGDKAASSDHLTSIYVKTKASLQISPNPYRIFQIRLLDAALEAMQRERTEQKQQEQKGQRQKRQEQERTPSSWWEVLGVSRHEPLSVQEAVYRAKAKIVHPDGPHPDAEKMRLLNWAIGEARKEREGA